VSKFIFFSVIASPTSLLKLFCTAQRQFCGTFVNENHIVKRIMRECIIVPMLRRSTPKKVPQEFPCEPMDCVVRLTASAFIRSTRRPTTRKPVVKRALDWGICECGAPSDCSREAAHPELSSNRR
jgi:hypothetical protein